MFKKTIIPLAVVLSTAVIATQASASVNVGLRTFYMYRDFDGNTESREALTQAVRVDGEHNFVDSFKIGASLFANAKIDDRGDSHLTGLLTSENEGYAKLGQIYAEYNYNEMFFAKAGRWFVNTPLLNDSDSRATPSTTQAIQLTGKFSKGQVYTIYSDRASSKTDDEFNRYEDANGDRYGIFAIGGDIAFDNGLSFATAFGDANDYSTQVYFYAGYKINDSFSINGIQYFGEGDGTNAAFDANMTNIYGSYTWNDLTVTGSFQTVSGDSSYDYWWGGDDNSSLMVMNSVFLLDFNNVDEDSIQLRVDYNVSAVPSLKLMARHIMGEYSTAAGDADESETDFQISYTIQSGWLEGLDLKMRYAHVEADAYEDIDDFRFIVNFALPQIW